MRFFCFFILLVSSNLFAQSFSSLVNSDPKFVDEMDLTVLKENQLEISMPFAKELILNPEQKRILQEKAIIKIELVYTKYRTSKTFNQKKLNTNRLVELNRLAPHLFENRLWDFELIAQTHGNSQEECGKMFHGFVLTYRPNSNKDMLEKEADYMQNVVNAMLKQDSLDQDTMPSKYRIKTRYDLTIGYVHDTIWYLDTIKPPPPPDFFYLQSLYKDTSVLSVFNRYSDWKDFVVVTDMTGSMSPYNTQVFIWLKAQEKKKLAKYFVFFNDGDETKSNRKKPLETKGVYVVENKSLKVVTKEAVKCMRNGSGGGEGLENDVEAIIEGIKYYPKAKRVILIADNYESMRDYDFINKINKPVHIVLCGSGVGKRVNVQYLDLTRQTKGTLHTSNSDVTDLEKIKENEHFFIDEKEYMFKKGRFHSIYEKRY